MRSSTSQRWRAVAAVGSAGLLVLGLTDAAGSSPAARGQADDPPTLAASLTPTAVAPGAEMTYSSIDPCPTVEGVRLHFSYWNEGVLGSGQEDALPLHSGVVEVDVDGSWTTAVPAPDDGGQYEIIASCLTDDQDPDDPAPGDPPQVHGEYSAIVFDVIPDLSEDPDTNTPSTPAPAEPADPIPAEPTFTG